MRRPERAAPMQGPRFAAHVRSCHTYLVGLDHVAQIAARIPDGNRGLRFAVLGRRATGEHVRRSALGGEVTLPAPEGKVAVILAERGFTPGRTTVGRKIDVPNSLSAV